jgi:signal transduction histidine kinase
MMGFVRLLELFFSERSFRLPLKLGIFFLSLLFFTVIAVIYLTGLISRPEARLAAYSFYIVIFIATYFCGFKPGMLLSLGSSLLVVAIFVSYKKPFFNLTHIEMELFPFLAVYFLIAVAVDWLRESYEKLEKQMERNQQLYEQARNIEKLAVAGEIAAGITHEIRNPLAVVHGYLQILRHRHGQEADTYSLLIEELNRANQIISDFLRFSRPSLPVRTQVCLNKTVETAVALIAGEAARQDVNVFFKPGGRLPLLWLDHEQILQSLLNLCVNGIQAMPGGGTLTIESGLSPDGKEAVVSVSDTGHGIPADILSKITLPFFTTRDHGTGLGLSITQSVVTAHDGRLSIQSKPGEGSHFRLHFPVRPESPCRRE